MVKPRNNKAGGKLKPRNIESTENQAKAVELRRQGMTFDQIAQRLGYNNPSGAYQAVQAGLQKVLLPAAIDVVKLELERMEEMYRVAFAALASSIRETGGTDPNFAAMDRCLGIIDRKLKLVNGGGDRNNINLVLGDLNVGGKPGETTVTVSGDKESYIAALARLREEAGTERAGLPEASDVDKTVADVFAENDILEAEIVEEDEPEGEEA